MEAGHTYADSMLQSSTGQAMVDTILSEPNAEISDSLERLALAENHVHSDFLNDYLTVNFPDSFLLDSLEHADYCLVIHPDYDDCSKCFNSDYSLSTTADDRLLGYKLFDGTRRGLIQCNISGVNTFLPLPFASYPLFDASNGLINFDLNPENNATEGQLSGFGFDPRRATFNTFNLIDDVDDPVIPHLLPSQPPSGATSLRIGNANRYLHINKMSRQFKLESSDDPLYTFSSAFVLQDPTGHTHTKPLFSVRALDQDGVIIQEICYIADEIKEDTEYIQHNGTFINFKPWSCDTLDLSSHVDELITIEYIVADCGLGAHWGYAYIADICESCGDLPTVDITADYDCQADEIVICGDLYVPDSFTYCELEIEFFNGGIKRDSVTNVTYNSSTGKYQYNFDRTEINALDPQGGYDVYAVATLKNVDGDTIQIRSTSAVPNIKDENDDILTDNDFHTDSLEYDTLFVNCFGLECVGNTGGNYVFRFNANHVNDLGTNYRAIESSISITGGTLDLDNFDSNDDFLIIMDGYMTITDTSVYNSTGFTVYGMIDISNGIDTCPAPFTMEICCGQAMRCHEEGFDCESLLDVDNMSYTDVEEQQVVTRTAHYPLSLPFISDDGCTIDTWTITVFTLDSNNTVTQLADQTFTYGGPSYPYTLTDTLDVSLLLDTWNKMKGVFFKITNNCDFACMLSDWEFDFNQGEGKRVGKRTADQSKLLISPNPVRSLLTIQYENSAVLTQADIIDMNGRLIKTFTLGQNQLVTQLKTYDIKNGVYLIRINNELESLVRTVIIQH